MSNAELHYLEIQQLSKLHNNNRAFMENHLSALKEKNLQLEVITELARGQHPFLKALYSKALLISFWS